MVGKVDAFLAAGGAGVVFSPYDGMVGKVDGKKTPNKRF
jgi:hypothetical protein